MYSIVVSTNIGSLGRLPLKDHMIAKRSRLIDACTEIEEEHGRLDALMIQECGVFNFEPIPWFSEPKATTSEVTYGKNDGGTRGTCIYLRKGVGVDTKDTKNEFSSAFLDCKDSRGNKMRIFFIGA